MEAVKIEEHARKLMAAHGEKAVAEAAQKAVALEQAGKDDEARDWRRIEQAIHMMRGPRST